MFSLKYKILFVAVIFAFASQAQIYLAKNFQNDPNLPEWAKLMYDDHSDPYEVKAAYENYYTSHPFEKTVHTQYYKRWASSIESSLHSNNIGQIQSEDRGGQLWTYCGPEVHFSADGALEPISEHSNIYSHDRSAVDNNVLYAGSESGGLYKSTDGGDHWNYVTKGIVLSSVSAVRCHPTDVNTVLFSGANEIYKSTDGGSTWIVAGQPSFVSQNVSAWEIAFHPTQPNVVFAATNVGLFKSTDTGDTWTEILPNECMTVQFKPNDPSVVYTVHFEPSIGIAKFYKSEDTGVTFTMYDNGWFSELPGFESVELLGGHMAVTEADPNRIYVALAGYGTYDTNVELNGWIGLYVSYDGGLTWVNNHSVIGTPYNINTHPNLMNFNADDGTYTQIHYNTTLVASQLDADKVLIGGLNLWKSEDAGTTFSGVAGYIGGLPYFHVDQQELRIYKTSPTTETIWSSNDGGINVSTDFMQSFASKCYGLEAVNLWGYDQGWNEDIRVGGRYHNGNMGYHEAYGEGNFFSLGGGEAATGYVNYSDENRTYFSDIGGKVLPEDIAGTPTNFSVGLSPNESYWFNESSRMLFDNQYFNVAWLGNANQLYKSQNGGQTWNLAYTFGTDANAKLVWIEQSYANPNVMFVQQRVSGVMKLWRTTDAGATWALVNQPLNKNNMLFTLGNAENEFWIVYPNATNTQKVYYTTDGGANYNNWSSASVIGSTEIWSAAAQLGTNGGIYIALLHGRVLYRNASMNQWVEYSVGLPAGTEPLRLVPFYRDGKIRLACWNLGVWEAPFYEASSLLVDFAARYGTFTCPGEQIHFVDHSVASSNATYSWSFPGATPSTSIEQNPTVVYNSEGVYDVTLTITDGSSVQSKTKSAYIASATATSNCINEGFESGNIPTEWIFGHSTGGGDAWTISNACTSVEPGTYAMEFANYWVDVQGNRDEIELPKTHFVDGSWYLNFDVAYALYGGQYSDTLSVLASSDCGLTWTEWYRKGGEELGTAPQNSNEFIPQSTEWRTETIDLNAYANQNLDVIVAFQNRGHWGNNIFVDEVKLCYTASVSEQLPFSAVLYPNPSEQTTVLGFSTYTKIKSLVLTDISGRVIQVPYTVNSESIRFDVSKMASGIYTLVVETDKGRVVKRLERN